MTRKGKGRPFKAVFANARYRARLIRALITKMAGRPDGVVTAEIQDEFWVLHDFEPSRILVAQQLAALERDRVIVRVSRGTYKLSPPPDMSKYTTRTAAPLQPLRAEGTKAAAQAPLPAIFG